MSGRRWAYFGVILGFLASVTANIASTVLKETDVSLWLRVPFAVFWPLGTYVAIEVLVRTDWTKSWSHRATRLVLAGPVGFVAAFVSYLHQHHLMVLAGEPGLAQAFGPLAVDGMLFGMTATLIITRVKAPEREYGVTQPDDPTIDWNAELKELVEQERRVPADSSAHEALLPAPVSAPPAPERTPRAPWDARKVIEMIQDGAKRQEIIAATGITPAPLGHMVAGVRFLQANPGESLPANIRVSAGNAQLIRTMVPR